MSPGSKQAYPGQTSSIDFHVLGPVTVHDTTGRLNIGGPKQQTVLAMLIANLGRPVSNDVIAEAVYSDLPPDRARRRVQTYVSTLRATLGDAIVKDGRGWSLRVDRSQIDACRFEDLYESVRADPKLDPVSAGRLLREALALWSGHPYADVEAHGLLAAEQVRLAELRVAAQAARVDADLRAGRHDMLIGEIFGLVSEHPFVETFRAQHMLALYRAGRQREALRSYRDLRDLLVTELGVEPSPELQELEQRILEQDSSLDLTPRPSIRTTAILAVDPGDPIELTRLARGSRENLLNDVSKAMREAIGRDRTLMPAGTALYTLFDTALEAVNAARKLADCRPPVRIAIDYGDVETSDSGATGVPVSRAAVLVSVAHRGQVLLSTQAQEAVVSDGGDAGLRFESLGLFNLVGVEGRTPIFQLLIGSPPTSFPPLDTERVPARLPGGGDRSVPGYELRAPVGSGSIGVLYRAYQPSVGREVLIEVIPPEQASDPDFVLSFEANAQRLALLDHPNINPLLDYWRDPSGAYLVYRYHRGGHLGDRTVNEPDRVLEQIGSALSYAHSLGLVHGSLRPDRVHLDDSGNAYLIGWPISDERHPGASDYSEYRAPEMSNGSVANIPGDVYSLGVLAAGLLSRSGNETRTGLDQTALAGISGMARSSVEPTPPGTTRG